MLNPPQKHLYKRKLKELENTEEAVAYLLHHFPHYRDCDKCLIIFYWRLIDIVGLEYTHPLGPDDVHALTPAETITRCRRIIQNNMGLFLPESEEVRQSRKISQAAVRDWSKR